MKHIKLFFAIIAGIFLFTPFATLHSAGIRDERNPQTGLPAELRQIMNKNRKITFPPFHPDIEDVIRSFVQLNLDKDEHIKIFQTLRQIRVQHSYGQDRNILHRIFGRADQSVFLTHEQLREEIHFLFDLLRHGYGGYVFFGGDDVFLPIRDSMITQLAYMPDPLQVSAYLNNLLIQNLRGVIADNHFDIQYYWFSAPDHVPYMTEEFILRKGKSGFITEIDGITHRVINVKYSPSLLLVEGILPTLSPEGEFVWAFGLVTAESQQNTIPITVFFENMVSGESYLRVVTLSRVSPVTPRPRTPTFAIREIDGITVFENRSLFNLSYPERNAFVQYGYKLRDKAVLVVDLRGNNGGSASLPTRWVGMYTGQAPRHNSLFVTHNLASSRVESELRSFFEPLDISMLRDQTTHWGWENRMKLCPRFMKAENLDEPIPTSVPNTPEHIPISNENLVIILTDKNVASAGELFVGYLRQLENVLVVGTNTQGTFFTGAVGRIMLPHSNLAVTFGTRLSLRPDLSQFEGVGFKPDLWVPPGESLERVLRFIERYGLAR